MRSNCLILGFAAALLTAPVFAGEAVPIDRLDAKITDAIKDKFPGAELISAERDTDDGQVKHEVQIRHQNAVWEVDVGADGTITEMERKDAKR